ncbi:unnamed protein product [Cuscuta campestris]|uniref:Uncharacterized protein n=1 Tax=Cuscuta campestris TaxID=132261 RepID=A0A484NPB7_9ASTE|nr:unnamed protein product [Cuscuta campestris]
MIKNTFEGTKEGRSALQISPSPPAAAAARVVFHDTAAGAMGKEEEVFSMDYTQPRRSPPIHNTRRP